MFESSTSFTFCDHFRVPYALAVDDGQCPDTAWRRFGRPGSRSALLWPAFVPTPEDSDSEVVRLVGAEEFTLCARLLAGDEMRAALPAGDWRASEQIVDDAGRHVTSVWRRDDGSVALPFDPSDAIQNLWSEAYVGRELRSVAGRARRAATAAYYRVRPALPRNAQLWLRRRYSRVQARRAFPRWPLETALHDLYEFLFDALAGVSDEPIPWIGAWPSGFEWAVVLTHDVEQQLGHDNVELLCRIEREAGVRSSWNFVPKRYCVDDRVVDGLRDAGFEIGVHGLYHDGRDLESERTLRARLPEIRAAAERWKASGFRSPATHRSWQLMPLLGFEYDSSSPDSDPFEPQAGGCCSLLPFFNDGLVELPITLPQDHTLFVILGQRDGRAWEEKAEAVRRMGGMALLITHPDYMLDADRLGVYRAFVERAVRDVTAWNALPRDVADWWRRRAASRLVREGDAWRIEGPASDHGAVQLRVSSAAR